jgi:acyl dehydratase
VRVDLEGRVGTVRRPSLVGALVMKAAAHTAPGGAGRGRHRLDFVTLAALVDRADFRAERLDNKDRKRLGDMVAACRADPLAMEPGHAAASLERLQRAAALG